MTTTTTSNNMAVIDCKKCKAPHFSYQLTCKRCGDYLQKEETDAGPTTHGLAVAGGILAVSTVILAVCLVLHAF
jgi:uncharacterized protein (DUF983 family)